MAAVIKYIESHLPENVLTNSEISLNRSNWSDQKIFQKTGISQRRISNPEETSLDMGVYAAEKLFNNYPKIKKDVDYIIFCTQTPDYFLPSGSCIIQDRLCLKNDIGTIDINQGCTGFVYALSVAKGLIEGEIAKNILLITSDTYSKIINKDDLSVRTIFGDGACATYVSKESSKTSGVDNFIFGSDGSQYDKLIVPVGGFRNKNVHDSKQHDSSIMDKFGNKRNKDQLYMDGAKILIFTLDVVPNLIKKLLHQSNLNLNDIDHFIFHQANEFIIKKLIKKMDLPPYKVPIKLKFTGNLVSSSIPITYKNCIQEKKINKGQRVMLIGFGVGLSWAGCVLRV